MFIIHQIVKQCHFAHKIFKWMPSVIYLTCFHHFVSLKKNTTSKWEIFLQFQWNFSFGIFELKTELNEYIVVVESLSVMQCLVLNIWNGFSECVHRIRYD